MDQERYWMWTKRKTSLNSHVLSSNIPSSYGDSWEEQAFAEDAAGPLGGCIWPPRSYTCTFCRREFRSAQALGGHMNVHRRDRARLKQNPSPNNQQILDHPSPPSMASSLQYNHPSHDQVRNPNLDLDHLAPAVAPTPPSRVSLLSPLTHGSQKRLEAPILSWSKLEAEKYFHVSDSTKVDKGSKPLESNSYKMKGSTITHVHHRIKGDLSSTVNLDSVIRKRYITTTVPLSYDHRVEGGLSCKKRKTDETLCFFPKTRINSADDGGQKPQSEVLDDQLSPTISTIENLDLELRLGDRS